MYQHPTPNIFRTYMKIRSYLISYSSIHYLDHVPRGTGVASPTAQNSFLHAPFSSSSSCRISYITRRSSGQSFWFPNLFPHLRVAVWNCLPAFFAGVPQPLRQVYWRIRMDFRLLDGHLLGQPLVLVDAALEHRH